MRGRIRSAKSRPHILSLVMPAGQGLVHRVKLGQAAAAEREGRAMGPVSFVKARPQPNVSGFSASHDSGILSLPDIHSVLPDRRHQPSDTKRNLRLPPKTYRKLPFGRVNQ